MLTTEKPVVTSTIYENVTRQIVEAIEQGAGNFEMPWHKLSEQPQNALNNHRYQGVNVLQLLLASRKKGFELPYWASYKQWQQIGAQVKRGEAAQLIVYFETKVDEKRDENGQMKEEKYFICRPSHVFNAAQVEGWQAPFKEPIDKTVALTQTEEFVAAVGAYIEHKGTEAFYDIQADMIRIPPRKFFKDTTTRSATEGYYATLLHELTHWTGHERRCSRNLKGRFGEEDYAMEELVAELGSAFLCADLGIAPEVRKDHAQYLDGWLRVLKQDPKAIFTASSKAAYASDWLHKAAREDFLAKAALQQKQNQAC